MLGLGVVALFSIVIMEYFISVVQFTNVLRFFPFTVTLKTHTQIPNKICVDLTKVVGLTCYEDYLV